MMNDINVMHNREFRAQTINDSGALSIDFIAAFTIFMIVFIIVITMISGLLINLQSKTIDFDAVAYRTGVILAEDPGLTSGADPYAANYEWTRWEFDDYDSSHIVRFGLAEKKNFPNVLARSKVEAFFNDSTRSLPEIQQRTMMFGDYPYNFNISIRMFGTNSANTIGDPYPPNAGYARRLVKIKEPSILQINASQYQIFQGESRGNFSVQFDPSIFSQANEYTRFEINPYFDGATIIITNISETRNGTGVMNASGSMVDPFGMTICAFETVNTTNAANILDTFTATLQPGCLAFSSSNVVNFPLVYHVNISNSNISGTVYYDQYNATQELTPAVMEVRVW